ncbi:MAG: presqualene diphosphate synthase HpnD, partial [Methylobacteriaceae bacterium]|nr:presqualene diphosphate synthase HpnD [Methylobacteriaceae bacterium]
REAMYAVYAFCRAVDDIADSDGPRPDRLAALNVWRGEIDGAYSGRVGAGMTDLAPAIPRYGLPREAFHDIVDGMEMDVRANIQAPPWATLDLYCDRVASAVGRLSARIFGLRDQDADDLAHHLGRALQLTNILRDLDEDAAIERLYLPGEALEAAGVTDLSPKAVLAHPGLDAACREVLARARSFFGEADRIMRAQPRSLVKAPRLMEAVYRAQLDAIDRRGFAAPRIRVRTRKLTVLGAVLRHAIA